MIDGAQHIHRAFAPWGVSGEKPAARTILLISSGGRRTVKVVGAAADAGSGGGDRAWPGAAANCRQHRKSTAAVNTRAITDLPPSHTA
jgi:hypothetical protein